MATLARSNPTGKRYPRIIAAIALLAAILATISVLIRVGPFAAIIVPPPPTALTASDLLPATVAPAAVADAAAVAPAAPGAGSQTGYQQSSGWSSGNSGSSGSNGYPAPAGQPGGTSAPTSGPTATAAPTAKPTATAAPTSTPTGTPRPSSTPSGGGTTYTGLTLAATSTCPAGFTASAYQCRTGKVTNNNDGILSARVQLGASYASVQVCAQVYPDQGSTPKSAKVCGPGSVNLSVNLSGGDYSVVISTSNVTATASVTINHS